MRLHGPGLVAVLGLMASCVGEPAEVEPLSWEEFMAQAYQEPESGTYIVNGDEPAETLESLHEAYDRYLTSVQDAALADEGIGSAQEPLAVNMVNGQQDKWSPANAMNLTYCVASGKGGFSAAQYAAVVAAMNTAAAEWESAARINLVHLTSQDAKCDSRNLNVVFDVSPTRTTSYFARAFFPSTSRRNRNILISSIAFNPPAPRTFTGIVRHELGHALGFRHEHTRPEAGQCFEDSYWQALTEYDRASIMHYPQCGGTQTGDLSPLDYQGAAVLYPAPAP